MYHLVQNDIILDPMLPHILQKGWEKQSKIGLKNFVLGWSSREWASAAKVYGSSKDPIGDIATLLTLLWDGWCEPIWETRNIS